MFSIRVARNDHLFGKKLFTRLTMCLFRERLPFRARARVCVSVCDSFPFSFEGGILDLVVLNPDNCIFIFF